MASTLAWMAVRLLSTCVLTLTAVAACAEIEGQNECTSLLQSQTMISRSEGQALNVASDLSSGGCAPLTNQGSHFTVQISVGTPPQRFDVVADTGSNAVIVSSCVCQQGGECSSQDKCFTGTNRSSSFAIREQNLNGEMVPSILAMTFGSGTIFSAIATDIVRVGSQSALMQEGLLLMVKRALRITGPFEGILGLGLPDSQLDNMTKQQAVLTSVDVLQQPYDQPTGIQALQLLQLQKEAPGFLSQAKVPRFSVCLNDGADGVLRLAPPPMANMIGAIGKAHWALDFGGISVGKASDPSLFCSRQGMRAGQSTPCAAIPDSGTTVIMAPQAHLNKLFAEQCSRWDRCMHLVNLTSSKTSKPANLSVAFQETLFSCHDWVNSTHGLDQELPALHFHFGQKHTIKLGGAGYVMEVEHTEIHYVKKLLGGLFPMSSPVHTKRKVCTPAFGAMSYETAQNGPIWILGLPIFYEYQVGYDLESKPPGISFSEEPCGSCGIDGVEQQTSSQALLDTKSAARQARVFRGPPRLPNVDVNLPL